MKNEGLTTGMKVIRGIDATCHCVLGTEKLILR